MTKILFVCMGNICRSPTAHAVMRAMVNDRGWQDRITIDSAGTHAYHVGEAPDSRSAAVAQKNGFSTAGLSARKISINDYDEFDYILAMDEDNLELIQYYAPAGHKARIELFLSYSDSEHTSVPDPYYGGAQGFDDVLDLVKQGCEALLDQIDY